jgi:hypothetical protein
MEPVPHQRILMTTIKSRTSTRKKLALFHDNYYLRSGHLIGISEVLGMADMAKVKVEG